MQTPIEILHRDNLTEGGFAGLKEHRLVKEPRLFGDEENNDGSWRGIANFVYLADARFMPHGETHMHNHREIDVISVMVDGRIQHEGSLENGKYLVNNDVQVQRAGGEGFSHNEINPDDNWNRIIQLWVLPETAGQSTDYKVYQPVIGKLTRIYGGNDTKSYFSAKTIIDIGLLNKGENILINNTFIAYVTRGNGIANEQNVEDGDLIRGETLNFSATSDVQLIVIHTNN